jgi:hypothetical protein
MIFRLLHKYEQIIDLLTKAYWADNGTTIARCVAVNKGEVTAGAIGLTAWCQSPLCGAPAVVLLLGNFERGERCSLGFGHIEPNRQRTEEMVAALKGYDINLAPLRIDENESELKKSLNSAGVIAAIAHHEKLAPASASMLFVLMRLACVEQHIKKSHFTGVWSMPMREDDCQYTGEFPQRISYDLEALKRELQID